MYGFACACARVLGAIAVATLLAACGGGGGGSASDPTPKPQSVQPGANALGASLGAASQNRSPAPDPGRNPGGSVTPGSTGFSGLGTSPPPEPVPVVFDRQYPGRASVWDWRNDGDYPVEVQIRLTGLAGERATLVVQSPVMIGPVPVPADTPPFAGTTAGIVSTSAAVGAVRSVWLPSDANLARTMTLVRQGTAGDGRTVNLWIEAGEHGLARITDATLDALLARTTMTDGAYDRVTGQGGPLWGPHASPYLMHNNGLALDVFLMNFDGNGNQSGRVGQYWSGDLLGRAYVPRSNEALAVYVDTENIWRRGAQGIAHGMATIAHELMHASNYYRRVLVLAGSTGVNRDLVFEPWLEEMTATMAADIAAQTVSPGFSDVRDMRFPLVLGQSMTNCPFLEILSHPQVCDSYAFLASFGAFLLRQHGLAFYRDLLHSRHSDSLAALDAAIRHAGGAGLDAALLRFRASAYGGIAADQALAGFGFPERDEAGVRLPEMRISRPPLRSSYRDQPGALAVGGARVIVRASAVGTLSRTITLAPGEALAVAVAPQT